MKDYGPGFADRRSASAKAKETLLKKAQAILADADPQAAAKRAAMKEKEAARRTAAAEKAARKRVEKAEKGKERASEEARKVEERRAEAARREQARKEEEARVAAEAVEKNKLEVELEANRKAARDARYAARKARQR